MTSCLKRLGREMSKRKDILNDIFFEKTWKKDVERKYILQDILFEKTWKRDVIKKRHVAGHGRKMLKEKTLHDIFF